MTDVANLELCMELQSLSGWKDQQRSVWSSELGDYIQRYTLGYLLRKLPRWIEPEKNMPHLLTVQPNPIGKGWNALYRLSIATPTSDRRHATEIHEADTPEDALCKLAIELFKQGVLKKASDANRAQTKYKDT